MRGGQYKQPRCADQIRAQYVRGGAMTESLDEGRVSFGNRDESEGAAVAGATIIVVNAKSRVQTNIGSR